jgi:hypothetical protein
MPGLTGGTGCSPRDVGPGTGICWLLSLAYGYIRFSRLSGISDVAEASCG